MVSNVAYSLPAEAAQDAQVRLVPHKDFTRFTLTKPGLAIKALSVLAVEVRTR